MPDNLSVVTTIVLLLPMFYLLLAAPAFLFVRLDIPQVARLLRTMFHGYFLVLLAIGLVATASNAIEGRLFPTAFIGALTGLVFLWRPWLMRRLSAGLADVQDGIAGAAPRLRRLHLMGMAVNAAQTGATLALIPSLVLLA